MLDVTPPLSSEVVHRLVLPTKFAFAEQLSFKEDRSAPR
jgi:hypothetical protein